MQNSSILKIILGVQMRKTGVNSPINDSAEIIKPVNTL